MFQLKTYSQAGRRRSRRHSCYVPSEAARSHGARCVLLGMRNQQNHDTPPSGSRRAGNVPPFYLYTNPLSHTHAHTIRFSGRRSGTAEQWFPGNLASGLTWPTREPSIGLADRVAAKGFIIDLRQTRLHGTIFWSLIRIREWGRSVKISAAFFGQSQRPRANRAQLALRIHLNESNEP